MLQFLTNAGGAYSDVVWMTQELSKLGLVHPEDLGFLGDDIHQLIHGWPPSCCHTIKTAVECATRGKSGLAAMRAKSAHALSSRVNCSTASAASSTFGAAAAPRAATNPSGAQVHLLLPPPASALRCTQVHNSKAAALERRFHRMLSSDRVSATVPQAAANSLQEADEAALRAALFPAGISCGTALLHPPGASSSLPNVAGPP